MRLIGQLCLIFFPIPLSAGLGTQLDVLLGVSLKQGGMVPKQSGQYLLDSFRVNSFIPAFQKIQEELDDLSWNMDSGWEPVFCMEVEKVHEEKSGNQGRTTSLMCCY